MKLRSQMLLASLLTLLVPGVAWHSVRQLDQALLGERENTHALTVANARVGLAESARLRDGLSRVPGLHDEADLYAEHSRYPLFIDGYADDWSNLSQAARRIDDLFLRCAERGGDLYLYASVADDRVLYHRPPVLRADAGENEQPDVEQQLVNGDSLEIVRRDATGAIDRWLLRALAPGPIDVLREERLPMVGMGPAVDWRPDSRVQAAWVEGEQGVQIEIRLPLPAPDDRLAIAYLDVDRRGESRTRSSGNVGLAALRRGEGGAVRRESDVAGALLDAWVPAGSRARLFDASGYRLADVNRLYDAPGDVGAHGGQGIGSGNGNAASDRDSEADGVDDAASLFAELGDAVLARLFEWLVVRRALPPTPPYALRDGLHLDLDLDVAATSLPVSRYVSDDNDELLGQLVPIGEGPGAFLLYETNERLAGAYAGNRLARLLALLTAVSLLVGGGLLLYASLLSLRIRRLSRDADRAVASDGRVLGLSGSRARDEIGDLSRNLSALLDRSAGYTDYLEALASRLSHELRTPLSVVRTSLENIERDALDSQSRTLLDRAEGGSRQLGALITALVESTRLEQTVQQSAFETVPLQAWLDGAQARYAQVYPGCRFALLPRSPGESGRRSGSAGWPAPVSAARWSGSTLLASAELLQQAYDKLVDNAVTFSRHAGIGLVAERLDDTRPPRVLLAVVNRGPALSAEVRASMFDPMVSHRDAGEGGRHLGLGLYIVRMVAEAHGGEVVARNVADGVLVGMVLPLLE